MTKLNIKFTLYFILSLYTFNGYPVKVFELKKTQERCQNKHEI